MSKVKNLLPEEEWAQGLLLRDEWANSLTHAIGLLLSFIGLFFLLAAPFQEGDHLRTAVFGIYGGSLILLYTASTLYHAVRSERLKKIFRTLDHCAIYLLIAGSYTPFTILILEGAWGWAIFGIIWSLAFLGILFKCFFGHRFKLVSTFFYLMMGWLVVIAAEELIKNFHLNGIYWVIAGGLSYTGGVVFYALDKRRFFHAIWHLFVLAGSICHYLAVLLYMTKA